jgi:hypothetical protein
VKPEDFISVSVSDFISIISRPSTKGKRCRHGRESQGVTPPVSGFSSGIMPVLRQPIYYCALLPFTFSIFRKSIQSPVPFLRIVLVSVPGRFHQYIQKLLLVGQTIIDRIVLIGMKHPFGLNLRGRPFAGDGESRSGLLSAHGGNWEIAGHLLNRLGTEMHIVMYDGRTTT